MAEAMEQLRRATEDLAEERRRREDADRAARRSAQMSHAAASVNGRTHRSAPAAGAAEPARRAAEPRQTEEPSGGRDVPQGANVGQAQRTEWIRDRIKAEGRPTSEEGWAELTGAVQTQFNVSARTARRDVSPFRAKELANAA